MKPLNICPYIYVGLNTSRKIQLLNNSAVDTGEMNIILKTVCEYCNVTVAEFMSKCRNRAITEARFIFTGIIYEHYKYTLLYVGKFMNRHHSSVLYYKKTCKTIDKNFRHLFEEALKASETNLNYHGFKYQKLQKAPSGA